MKIGVIGAGPAGLCAIKQSLSFGCDVVAFEQTDKIGGTWNYTDDDKKDKNGLDVHSSMYEGLLTNIPKEIMGFPDFPFPSQERSFITSNEVLQYFHLYADTFDLRKHVKFEHFVVRVRPVDNDKWEFIVKNLVDKKLEVFIFDAVLVCNGFSVPFIPKIPGQEAFNGQQMHSHVYRNSRKFQNQNVLVIGGGPSGIDLAVEIGKVANQILWSNHTLESLGQKVDLKLPENSKDKPDVKKFTDNGAEFIDGSFEKFSHVIYATGYDYKFPFLSIDCGLQCYQKYVKPLYKHCININRPSLAIIGLPYFAVAMPMFDLQIRFCLTFMTRRKFLPSRHDMLQETKAEMKERWLLLKRNKAHFLGMERHQQYYEELAKAAQIEGLKPVVAKIFNHSFTTFFNVFLECRNHNYKIIDEDRFSVS